MYRSESESDELEVNQFNENHEESPEELDDDDGGEVDKDPDEEYEEYEITPPTPDTNPPTPINAHTTSPTYTTRGLRLSVVWSCLSGRMAILA